ncbi:FAD:protein FMN transferase [invertebrate metagenome]|uniref:FAD:protein FMN transferase n=1 Tax=invertebrate metagenome TaxID=1711999 RepID=A0A2H9TA24_9ZZZZ
MFNALVQDPDPEWMFINGSYTNAHQHSSGAAAKNPEGIGKSREGLTSKIHGAAHVKISTAPRLSLSDRLYKGKMIPYPLPATIDPLSSSSLKTAEWCLAVASISRKRTLILSAILIVVTLIQLATHPRLKQFQGETMGTTYHVTYVGNFWSHSIKDVSTRVHEALEDINIRMSTYRNDSELMKLNHSKIGQPFSVSPDLAALIQKSKEISRLSNGAYDVTIGQLVNLWGFGPQQSSQKSTGDTKESVDESAHKQNDDNRPVFIQWIMKNYPGNVPSDEAIDKARQQMGYQYVRVDTKNNTVTRLRPVFIDLSSIAKGYGVDQAAAALEKAGIKNFLVEVGGEIKVKGTKPNSGLWRLAVRGPDLTSGDPAAIVALDNKAMATSGDYLNYFEIDGKRYSHTINPLTGWPEMKRIAEVAVITDNVAEADALATMFMVLGDKKGLIMANEMGYAACFTYHSGKGFKTAYSDTFLPYMVKNPDRTKQLR